MNAPTTSSAMHLLLLEPAMGFGPGRVVMAPAIAAGARLPAGVRSLELVAVPSPLRAPPHPLRVAARGRGSLVVSALPRALDFTIAALDDDDDDQATRATTDLSAGVYSAEGIAMPTPFAGFSSPRSTSSASASRRSLLVVGRRGVLAIGAAAPRDFYVDEDEDEDDDTIRATANLSAADDARLLRSKRDIAAWVELARLQTRFEVAFDAGLLQSGRDLRRVLDAIGEMDVTAPSPPCSVELCQDRISSIVGEKKLDELQSARTQEDYQFKWSALAAQSTIESIEQLMAILHGNIIMKKDDQAPNLPLNSSSPIILRQLLKVISECSTIFESTKFRRPQSSIRFRLLEAHALTLEHLCSISMDVYEEASQEAPDGKWTQFGQQLRNRRISLFEQDMDMIAYLKSIGVEDTEKVVELVERVCDEVKRAAGRLA